MGPQQQFSPDRFTAVGPVWSEGGVSEEGSFCCESKRLDSKLETACSVWVDTVGFWRPGMPTYSCLLSVSNAASGGGVRETPTTSPPPRAHSIKPFGQLFTTQHLSACVPVRLCKSVRGEIARKNRRAPQSVRMQQPDEFFLSCPDFTHRRLNPTSFRSDPKIKLYP